MKRALRKRGADRYVLRQRAERCDRAQYEGPSLICTRLLFCLPFSPQAQGALFSAAAGAVCDAEEILGVLAERLHASASNETW